MTKTSPARLLLAFAAVGAITPAQAARHRHARPHAAINPLLAYPDAADPDGMPLCYSTPSVMRAGFTFGIDNLQCGRPLSTNTLQKKPYPGRT